MFKLLKTTALISAAVLTATTVVSIDANAHHSRANFDQGKTVVITGEVTEFAWSNPHIFIEVVADGVTWLVESHSVTGMRRRGWDANVLKVGDKVTINGTPDKDTSKKFMSLNTIKNIDGSDLVTLGMAPPAKKIEPSTDFSGTWAMDLRFFDIRGAGGPPSKDWPYTAEGLRQAAAYDPEDSPELQCLELGVPRMMIYPYSINLTRDDKSLKMFKEHLNEERTLWFSAEDALAANKPPSPTGTSVAKQISDTELHVVTTNFTPTLWGVENALNSSSQKVVEEVYALSNDGVSLDVTFTITDPVLFTAPVVREIKFNKEADREFAVIGCDPRAADRHVTLATTGRTATSTEQNPPLATSAPSKKSWWQRLTNR